ncbi:MAG TPA: cupin domain-containing protein [Gammaproteobacteria bacterium]
MPQPLDPMQNYLLLETDGTAVTLPGGETFWKQLMSGRPTDPGVQRLMNAVHGRLLSLLSMDTTWTSWEMHPAGDEILFLVSGELTLVLDEDGNERCVELTAGKLAIVPKGVWHTARLSKPCVLLALTDGLGTQHRPLAAG